MALDSYDNLVSAVAKWLHRSSMEDVIPDFIALAETRINALLRVRAMEVTASGSTTGTIALPTGFRGLKALHLNDGGQTRIVMALPASVEDVYGTAEDSTGYVLRGDSIVLSPMATYDYTITYWAAFSAIGTANQTNWVLTNYPSAYLFGALAESAPYLVNDQRLAVWEAKFVNAIEEIQSADRADRYGPNLAVMRG